MIVRKAYGAGLYAMAGPAFDPDCCLALPGAHVAVMGPQAAVNAVYFNELAAIPDGEERAARTAELRREYAADIDILHLASELVVDAVVSPSACAPRSIRRFAAGCAASCANGRPSTTPSRRSDPSLARRPRPGVASSADAPRGQERAVRRGRRRLWRRLRFVAGTSPATGR